MKVSLNWVRKLTDVSVGLNQLLDAIGSQLGAIEEVEDLGAKYKGAIIVRVVSVRQHANADRLHVCLIDDGNAVQNVPRNEHGFVQVICGAPNVQADMLAVWLPPGTTVPETYGSNEPFVLSARDMRGEISQGMLASQRELALGSEHSGILSVDEPARAGEMFADVYELNDFIIDIENKMFTHRPDLFGILGIAREIAGINGNQFKSPAWYTHLGENPLVQEARSLPLVVENNQPGLVPRFMAVVIAGVTLRQSPILFQSYLIRVGIRPINNLVDVTNYMMVLTGQPMHAYDYDRLREIDKADNGQVTLQVRSPYEDEQVVLLDGRLVKPGAESPVISTASAAVGLGGVMGGLLASIDESTENIVLECATFDMYATRRTAMQHGLFTDAVTRFTKGQSPLQNEYVMVKAVEIIKGMAGGQVASTVFDDRHFDGLVASTDTVHQPIKLDVDFVNDRLGSDLSEEQVTDLLKHVEFSIEPVTDGVMVVTAPFWRTDIEHPEDLVEEIGRLYGFDRLPMKLPGRDMAPPAQNKALRLRGTISQTLAAAGATETLSYSFVHGDMITKAGQSPEQAFSLSNALSPALQYYRLSLTPSLLQTVHPNLKAGYGQLAIFEQGKLHAQTAVDEAGLPVSSDGLAFVFAADPKTAAANYGGAAFYQARQYLMTLLRRYRLDDGVELVQFDAEDAMSAYLKTAVLPFDAERSLLIRYHDKTVGILGEYKPGVRASFKLPAFCAGFEVETSLFKHGHTEPEYKPLPRFPGIQQDMTLKLPAATPYDKVYEMLSDHIEKHRPKHTVYELSLTDAYQSAEDAAHKQLSFRLHLTSTERTLTDKEVALFLDHTAEAAKTALNAERV